MIMGHSDISIQLHSLRGLGSIDAALRVAADAGYNLVEPVGGYLVDPSETRRKLDALKLSAPTCHVNMEVLRERLPEIASACRTIGTTHLFVPAVPPEERDAPIERWAAIGRELGEMATRLSDLGIVFGYHNHYEVSIGTDDATALDLIFEHSEGSPLLWQADVAWLSRCGKNAAVLLQRYSNRLFSIHVKDRIADFKDDPEGGWRVAGNGMLGWNTLWPFCKSLGAQYMVMEHDMPLDPKAFAIDAMDKARALGGVA